MEVGIFGQQKSGTRNFDGGDREVEWDSKQSVNGNISSQNMGMGIWYPVYTPVINLMYLSGCLKYQSPSLFSVSA